MDTFSREEIIQIISDQKEFHNPQSLLTAAEITVQELRKSSTNVSVSFKVSPEREHAFTLPELKRKHYILVAKITTFPKDRGRKGIIPSYTVVQDETGYLPCLLKGNCDMSEVFNSTVFLLDWNYVVYDDCVGYIELNSFISLKPSLDPNNSKTSSVDVVSVSDALTAIMNRDKLKPSLLSVCGKVIAITQIFRMKSDDMFLLKLGEQNGPQINILVKRPDQLHWHTFISPHAEYVFTMLRPTTVQKGTHIPTKVYVAWEKAVFIPISNWSGKIISLKEWLGLLDYPPNVILNETTTDVPGIVSQKLFTYEGRITEVTNAELGIYVLDDKTGLCLTFLPGALRLTSLRPGTKLRVYNAHIKGAPQKPKIQLICCVHSCVKIIEFSPYEEVVKDTRLEDPPFSVSMMNQFSLNLDQIENILQYEHLMKEKFGSIVNSEFLYQSLLSTVYNHPEGGHWDKARPPLDQFLSDNHQCTPFKQDAGPPITTPVPIKALRHRMSDLDTIMEKLKGRYTDIQPSPEQLKTQLYWNLIQEEIPAGRSGEVLVGVLRASKRTGQMQLLDNTGSIDVVMIDQTEHCHEHSWENHSNSYETKSGGSNSEDNQTNAFSLQPDSCSVVYINKYTAITEAFLTTAFPTAWHIGEQQYILRSRIQSYIVISSADVTILKQNKTQNFDVKHIGTTKCDKRSLNLNEASSGENLNCKRHIGEDVTRKVFHVVHSGALMVESYASRVPNLRFCAVGCFIDSYFSSKSSNIAPKQPLHRATSCFRPLTLPKTQCVSTIQESHCLSRNGPPSLSQNATIKNGPLQECSVSTCGPPQPSQSRKSFCTTLPSSSLQTSTNCDTNISRSSDDLGAIVEPCVKIDMKKHHVLLVFEQDAVRHFHFIEAGDFYCVSVPNKDKDSLNPKYLSVTVQSAVEKFKARQCIVLPPSVRIDKLHVKTFDTLTTDLNLKGFLANNQDGTLYIPSHIQDEFNKAQEKLMSVKEILDDSCSGPLVSVRGEITHRTHKTPESSGHFKSETLTDRIQEINSMLGVSILDNKSIELSLRDENGSETLTVYMSLQRSSFPLALIPGAIVEFAHIERRVSRNNCTVYCQYIAVSTVKVKQLGKLSARVIAPDIELSQSTSRFSQSTNGAKFDLKSFHFLYLGHLLNSGNESPSFYSVCQVSQIMRLSLKSACNKCGREITSGNCSSLICRQEGHHLLARANVLVEDGSGSAIVLIRGELVRDLFGLSASQWCAVEDKLSTTGELFLQQFGGGQAVNPHPLYSFFYALSNSNSVKHLWKMYLTPRRLPDQSKPTFKINNMDLNDFSLKSVNTGNGTVDTHCLPFSQLTAVRLEQVDMSALILQLLDQANSQ